VLFHRNRCDSPAPHSHPQPPKPSPRKDRPKGQKRASSWLAHHRNLQLKAWPKVLEGPKCARAHPKTPRSLQTSHLTWCELPRHSSTGVRQALPRIRKTIPPHGTPSHSTHTYRLFAEF